MNSILSELEFDPERGALLYKGVRYLLIRPETLDMFYKAVEEKIGEHAHHAMHRGGFTGGSLSAKKYRDVFGLDAQQSVEFMARMGTEIGWGKIEIARLDLSARVLEITVASSPFAPESLAIPPHSPSKHGVCHLLRGVFAGLASGIFDCDVDSREVECIAMGDPQCRIFIQGAV
ncbi:MAG: XylR N-terminal domain-containing protein [Anaerolineales bacterium]|nr:XylR N-terminal domain-containing protein [Anaerolineales bacterium]